MSLSATVRALVLAGATPEMILAVVEVHEATDAQILAERKANEAARTARYRERGGGQIPADLRAAVFERDGHACLECSSTEHLQCDHIHPVSKGGPTTFENLQTLCRVCNARKKDRIRKSLVRGSSADKTGQDRKSEDAPHVGEPARVVIPFSSSLRSEEVTSEAKASSVNASSPAEPVKPKTKPPKSDRGTRLPDTWEPSEADVTVARAEGLTDEEINRAALEFRNYWCSRSRDATRLSWPKTWHNRCIEIGERKRRNGARLAASPNNPGGGRRGASTFADIYARRHGYTEG